MNSPNGTLFLMAWNRPWHGVTTAKIMPALLEFLYREFCRARLAEMRKSLLIRPDRRRFAVAAGSTDELWAQYLRVERHPPIDRPSGASSGSSGAAHASL